MNREIGTGDMNRGKRIEQIAAIVVAIRNCASEERAAGLVSLFAFAQTDPGALIDVLLGCLNLLRGGEITPADVNPYIPAITAAWDRCVSAIQAFERRGDSEGRDADEYQELSFLARIALDLLVYAADVEDAGQVLRQALALSDPYVKMAYVFQRAAAVSVRIRAELHDFRIFELRTSAGSLNGAGEIVVSVVVKNTGTRAGDEVVQMYVKHIGSAVERPMKELRGFQRIAIEPNETRTVQLPLKKTGLTYWDAGTHSFVVEPGTVSIMVGAFVCRRASRKEN